MSEPIDDMKYEEAVEGQPEPEATAEDALEKGSEEALSQLREECFPEDTGTCPIEVRHAIAALIKRRYISADEDKRAWEGLMLDPALVKSRLADALLMLKLDRIAGIAYAQQVELEDDTVPYKVKSIGYFNNVQSLLMVSLVTKYFSSTAAGESRVWIETEEMRETMGRLFDDAADLAGAEAQMNGAIGAMEKNGYLRMVADGRYEVMPVVGVVYTLDEIRSVLGRYGLDQDVITQGREAGDE